MAKAACLVLSGMERLHMEDKDERDKIGLVLGNPLTLMINGSTTKERLGERKRIEACQESNDS